MNKNSWLEVPRRLFAPARATLGMIQSTACNDGSSLRQCYASRLRLIPALDSQAAPVCTRRESEPRSKGGREVSVTGEPTSQSDIDQRHQSASNQSLSLLQSHFEQIT